MLAKKYKIKSSKEFQKIYKHSRKLNSNLLFVKFATNNYDISRFGVVVSRKVSSLAVKRNKIKRQIFSVLRDIVKQFNKSYDIILIARKKISQVNYQEIKKDIIRLLKNIK